MSSAGQKIGDTIKGVLNVGHGAGESIRGNINQALDSAGEGLRKGSSNDNHAVDSHPAHHGKSNDYTHNTSQHDVANKGNQEFKQGIDSLAGVFGKNNSTTNTSSTTTPNTTNTTNTNI